MTKKKYRDLMKLYGDKEKTKRYETHKWGVHRMYEGTLPYKLCDRCGFNLSSFFNAGFPTCDESVALAVAERLGV
jgi:hypothetical protein